MEQGSVPILSDELVHLRIGVVLGLNWEFLRRMKSTKNTFLSIKDTAVMYYRERINGQLCTRWG